MSDNDIMKQDAPVDNPEAEYAGKLIGEGKPYADLTAAEKALYHKDLHIKKLETEAEEYRQRLQQAVTLEEFMDRMEASKQPPAAPVQTEQKVVNEAQANPASDPSQVLKAVDERFHALKEEERRAANASRVKQELTKRFGQTYETSLRQRVAELGLSDKEANDLARTRPDAFLAMVGTPQKGSPDVVPPSGIRGVQAPTGKKFRDFQKVYRENPQLYNSERFQLEMAREAKRQGPSFYE